MKNLVRTILCLFCAANAFSQPRMYIDLSQSSWNITLDPAAKWATDTLYLPPINRNALPVNAPTQGWETVFLHPDTSGIRLPATVEQYFWGWNGQTFGVTGNYTGVSWFTTKVFIPREWEGKRLSLQVGSVRFRAEIFVNRKTDGNP
jgi:hypothetical protein